MPEFIALLIGLVTYTAAFIAEVVRAGILAVQRGQTEAAYAVGLRPGPTLRLVVVPQAMRVIIPPLTSQYLNLTKNSSLAVAVGYPDLVQIFTGTVLNQTGQAVEVVALTMAVYLTISLATSLDHEFLQLAHRAGGALSDGDIGGRLCPGMFPPIRCRRPCVASGAIGWLRANLFSSPFNIALTTR